MDALWYAYVAGFFDGEGSVSIVRNRSQNRSDYHKLVVRVTQRSKHRLVLDRICEEFGGKVFVRSQQTRVSRVWAEQADWQLQSTEPIRRFFEAIQPYLVIKAAQAELALEFISTFVRAGYMRDSLGRVRDRILPAEQIELREQQRLRMRELNELGPPRVKSSQLPPLDLRHRQVPERFDIDPSTIERGTKRYNAKLTDDDVRAIRAAYATGDVKQTALATQYGVSVMLISGIVRRTRWKHITD